jgi:hypothetical protein
MQRRLLSGNREWREQRGVDCSERELGSKPSHY